MEIKQILLSEDEIQNRVRELGRKISDDFRGRELIVVGVLKGCFVFLSDLIRQLQLDAAVYFMELSSYGNGTESSGEIRIKKDIDAELKDRDVLIVEDIVDSGNTLFWLKEQLWRRGPRSLSICTIFNKPSRRMRKLEAEYVGFDIPNEFVVGYGLDYAERYRGLPYLAVLGETESDTSKEVLL